MSQEASEPVLSLRIPRHDLVALAGTAVILLMMGLPWVSTTLFAGEQGIVEFALGGDNRLALPTNAPPELASQLRELQPVVEWGHLLVALGLPAGMRAALRLRFGRAALGSLATALAAFTAFSLIGQRLASEGVQAYVALLPGGAGVLLGSLLYVAAWGMTRGEGVDPRAVKDRMAHEEALALGEEPEEVDPLAEPSRRRSAYRALEIGTYVAFTLAAFTLEFGLLGSVLIVGGALGLGVVMLLVRQGAAWDVVVLGLGLLGMVYAALLAHVLVTGPPALFALAPLAAIAWAWHRLKASTRAFTPPAAPRAAAVLLAVALVTGGLGAAVITPLTTSQITEAAVLSTGPSTPPPSEPQDLALLPDVDDDRPVLRAFEEADEPTLNTTETIPASAGSNTTFLLDPPLDQPLPLAPGEPILVVWTLAFDAQPSPIDVRFRVLDGERVMAQRTVSVPPLAGQTEPVTVETELTPRTDTFTSNVGLDVRLEGGHVGGRHVLNESAMVVKTPPGFAPVT